MGQITHPDGIEPSAGSERHSKIYKHSIIEGVIWGIGLLLLIASSLFFRMHHDPLPGEMAFSRAVQALHLWPWVLGWLMFVSTLNDIPPSIVAVVLWVAGLCLFRKFRQAIFLALVVGVGNGIDALIGDLVGRPRPSSQLIHVDTRLVFNSFPSGHSEHDVVFYGFLLYLSFTRPVREWRYRWALLPLQIFAVAIILSIGFSRIYEGEHWLADVLGGYLSGAVWLYLFIFLYRWTQNRLIQWHIRKTEQQRAV